MLNEKVSAIVRDQATQRAAKYNQLMAKISAFLQSDDPKHKAIVKAHNARLNRKALTPGQVHVDSILTSISVQYKNGDLIGTDLMPVAPTPKLSGKYFIYDKRNRLAYPDDSLGVRASANEISQSRSVGTYACQDYGLKEYLDAETIANEDAPLNEMVDLVQNTAYAIALKEEQRIATKMTTAGNYPTANKATLAAGVQWDSAGFGDPISDLQTANAALWQGNGPSRKVAFSCLGVYNVLARHPAIRELFKYTANGLATPDQIAGYFGWAKYLVSEARNDTANEAQTANYSRIWGNFFGLCRVADRPSLRNAAFGYTFRFGDMASDQWFDISLGKRGGYYNRTTVSEDHNIIASDTGYLITTPVSTAAAGV